MLETDFDTVAAVFNDSQEYRLVQQSFWRKRRAHAAKHSVAWGLLVLASLFALVAACGE